MPVALILAPIQQQLKWVIDGLVRRQKQDDRLGQTDWGERWWFPPEQSDFVRQQLKNTHAELIEQSSDYEDAVRWGLSSYVTHTVQGIPVPSHDPARVYLGKRLRPHGNVFVWVKDSKGKKYALKHGDRPYHNADGNEFEWGYGGGGPTALSRSILTDALDGDMALAAELEGLENGFFEKFILRHPRERDLKISRAAVLGWLREAGKYELYERRRKSVADNIAAHAKVVAEREDLLASIQQAGELRSLLFPYGTRPSSDRPQGHYCQQRPLPYRASGQRSGRTHAALHRLGAAEQRSESQSGQSRPSA